MYLTNSSPCKSLIKGIFTTTFRFSKYFIYRREKRRGGKQDLKEAPIENGRSNNKVEGRGMDKGKGGGG